MKNFLFIFLSICFTANLNAQKPFVKGWHLLDYEKDGYLGISLHKAYDLLKGRKSLPVIVGVIDSGVDTTHEDLKNVLWHNPGEIPGDGKDNDGNGYIDDVYGWNFLGNAAGENVTKESMEITRIYQKYAPKFAGKTIDTTSLSAGEKAEYAIWKRADKEAEFSDEDRQMLRMVKAIYNSFAQYDSLLVKGMGRPEYSKAELELYEPSERAESRAKMSVIQLYQMLQFEDEKTNSEIIEELNAYISHQEAQATVRTATGYDMRGMITGDDPYDWNSREYGNSDVMATTSRHGTHVSGIIGARRNNGLGIDGIADNVKIMAIRAVPDGDEHDKDIALAIRYAVDNGAKVINMSFGKGFSPRKAWVDDAIRYAASKDVLLVTGSGNDAQNTDEIPSFPTDRLDDGSTAVNLINVSASSDVSIGPDIVADFSNYGKQSVDVLAPGKKIYSTVPAGNRYALMDGTSMASPVVAGIAALLRSYFPELTAHQTRQLIERSADRRFAGQMVTVPGKDPNDRRQQVLDELFAQPGIVNAAVAVEMALEIKK